MSLEAERVYAAERRWRDTLRLSPALSLRRLADASDARDFVRRVEADPRFQDRYPLHRPVLVVATDLRMEDATYRPGAHRISVPFGWGGNEAVVLHELAHAVAQGHGHDARFVREFRWLVGRVLGADYERELAVELERAGAVQKPKILI